MKKALIYTLIYLSILSFESCKVRYSLLGAAVGMAQTISIDYFPNMADLVYAPLSQSFTNKLKDRFIADTNLLLVKQEGDLHFEGQIVGYRNDPVTVTANESASAFRLSVTVKVKFTNKKDKEFEFEKTFSRFRDYTDNNFSSVEANLVSEIVEELVDDIFKESVVNW